MGTILWPPKCFPALTGRSPPSMLVLWVWFSSGTKMSQHFWQIPPSCLCQVRVCQPFLGYEEFPLFSKKQNNSKHPLLSRSRWVIEGSGV